MQKSKTNRMAVISLMSAIMCILGPLTLPLPVSPVPVSLLTLVLYLSVYVLGMKGATAGCLVYLLLGLIGLPVFSGFTGGIGKLLGPTGGYMTGYVFLSAGCGFFVDRWPANRVMHIAGMVLGTMLCYLFGTIWLGIQSGISLQAAFFAGVLPFIPTDAVKIAAAAIIGPVIRKRLRRAGL